jgi:hypothetical protein
MESGPRAPFRFLSKFFDHTMLNAGRGLIVAQLSQQESLSFVRCARS